MLRVKTRRVDVRLPGKGNSNSHGARPVHLIITMIRWIPTSRLSIKNSLSLEGVEVTATAHRTASSPPLFWASTPKGLRVQHINIFIYIYLCIYISLLLYKYMYIYIYMGV